MLRRPQYIPIVEKDSTAQSANLFSYCLVIALAVTFVFGGNSNLIAQTTNAFCGDGIINLNEQCDGADLGNMMCSDLGYASGSLSCDASCSFSTVNCFVGNVSNFPIQLSGDLTGMVAVDWDNNPEGKTIFASSRSGLVHAFDYFGNPLNGFPLNVFVRGNPIIGEITKISAGQLDGDAGQEIVFSILNIDEVLGDLPQIAVVDTSDGLASTVIRTINLPRNFSTYPVLADIDGDGIDEILVSIFGQSAPAEIFAYEGDGTLVPNWPIEVGSASDTFQGSGDVSVADLDGDGDVEILVPYNNYLYAFHHDDANQDGSLDLVAGNWPFMMPNPSNQPSFAIAHAASIGDIDGDGALEIVVTGVPLNYTDPDNKEYQVYALEADGSVVAGWPKLTQDKLQYGGHAALGDMDNNGYNDVSVSDKRGNLYVWDGQGIAINDFNLNFGQAPSLLTSSPAIADVDRDGLNEIVLHLNNKLMLIDDDGSSSILLGSVSSSIVPLIVDLDGVNGDKGLSILAADNISNTLHEIEIPENKQAGWDQDSFNPPDRLPWAQLAHDAAHTGLLQNPCSDPDEVCIEIIEPNGGQEFAIGDTVTVRWHQNRIDSVIIGLKKDYDNFENPNPSSGDPWIVLGYDVDRNSSVGEFTFTIEQEIPLLDTYRIYVQGIDHVEFYAVIDHSDASFSIVEAPDTDGDGVSDFDDNCPNTPNANQQDIDGNGVGDACDPNYTPPNVTVNATVDGQPLTDVTTLDVLPGATVLFDVQATDPDGLGYPIFQAFGPQYTNLISYAWHLDGASVPGPLYYFFNRPPVTFNEARTYNIAVSVFDTLGAKTTKNITVNVNAPPVVNLNATINGQAFTDVTTYNVPVGTTIAFDVQATDSDGLGYPIFSWLGSNVNISYIWNLDGASVPGTLYYFFNRPPVTFNEARTHNLSVWVYDSLGAYTKTDITVNVTEPPTCSLGPWVSNSCGGSAEGVTCSGNQMLQTRTLTPADCGMSPLPETVQCVFDTSCEIVEDISCGCDGDPLKILQSVQAGNNPPYNRCVEDTTGQCNQSPNSPPIINVSENHTITEGDVYTISLSATDPDGDNIWITHPQDQYLLYPGDDASSSSLISSSPGSLTFEIVLRPSFDQAGDYEITVSVRDQNNAITFKTIYVTVLEACGNGTCDAGENSNSCPVDCGSICGDGNVDPGEECDDGNTDPYDGCTATCRIGTVVDSDITSLTTWDLEGSPYFIENSITIATGSRLNIEPGVTVIFNGDYGLFNNGTLDAQGTPESMITFTSGSSFPRKDDWKWVEVKNSSVVRNCKVEYGWIGLYATGSTAPTIENNLLENNHYGIYVNGGSEANVTNNTVRSNHNGITVQNSNNIAVAPQAVIANNLIEDNPNGLIVNGKVNPDVNNNIITGSNYGVHLAVRGSFFPSDVRMQNNEIYGNSSYNVRIFSLPGVDISDLQVNMENNWWGTIDQNAVELSIFDHSDDAELATVLFTPVLDGPGGNPVGICGDGNVDPGESCDDGNAVDGDGCSSTCEAE